MHTTLPLRHRHFLLGQRWGCLHFFSSFHFCTTFSSTTTTSQSHCRNGSGTGTGCGKDPQGSSTLADFLYTHTHTHFFVCSLCTQPHSHTHTHKSTLTRAQKWYDERASLYRVPKGVGAFGSDYHLNRRPCNLPKRKTKK